MNPCSNLSESLVLPFASALMISHVEIDGKTDGNSVMNLRGPYRVDLYLQF